MNKHLIAPLSIALLFVGSFAKVQADASRKTLLVTMTNDPVANGLFVLDAATHARLQTISTSGKGGVSGNALGVKQYNGKFLAAVNNGSGTVALFRRAGNQLVFEQLISTTSPPVSIDFADGHMYVAGAFTVDSFVIHGNHIGALDGPRDWFSQVAVSLPVA